MLADTSLVRIVFTSNVPILISSFATQGYWSGGQAHLRGDVNIKNVSGLTVSSLTARLEVFDQFGNHIGQVEQTGLSVDPYGAINVNLILSGSFPNDRYLCHVFVLDALGVPIAQVSEFVWLSAGELLNFLCPNVILRGEDITFSADFRNNGSNPLSAFELASVYGAGGTEFATLPGPQTGIQPGETRTLNVQWNTLGKPLGLYKVLGSVLAGGQQYGPLSRSFLVSSGHELRVSSDEISFSPSTIIFCGRQVTINSVAHNDGLLPVDSIRVQFFEGKPDSTSTQIGLDQSIDVIPAGGSSPTQVLWETGDSPGDRIIYLKVDPYNTVEEGIETDNEASILVKIFRLGDANSDTRLRSSDIVYLINYLFRGGPPPVPLAVGDVNCDGKVNIHDVVYLINYLFKGGPPPGDPDNDGTFEC